MDVIHEIINVSDVNTIINLCMASKDICSTQMWRKIADREDMPLKTTVEEWIKEYLYHQYEVNQLIHMLKDKIIMTIQLPTSFLMFDEKNTILYANPMTCQIGGYFINSKNMPEEELVQLFMKLFYQFPNVYIYRHPKIAVNIPLRKRHLKYFIEQSILTKRTKTRPYKNAMMLWDKYYKL